MYHIITKKKEGKALSREEIAHFVKGYTEGRIPDYQAASLLMAICLKGMNEEETAILTEEMMKSGDVVDLSRFGTRSVDKHSTGGVGDKTTLIVAPIVAAAGAVIAKMSGRGLGFTGGTVDKMESIPGMKTSLGSEEFFRLAAQTGICVTGQSGNLAPADKKLYALRDVTATVDSIPLIAASIMSKKLAAGNQNIVLDVKYGSGAFMKTAEEATLLAQRMVTIGKNLGRRVMAFVTDMDLPLGKTVGNALEVREAIEILKGEGDKELSSLCLSLAAAMLSLSLSLPEKAARERAEEMLKSGAALEKMREWISSQGGDAACLSNPDLLPLSSLSRTVSSPEDGYLFCMNTEEIGFAAGELGAGRKTKEDAIDFGAGILLHKKTGDRVKKGEPLATLYASTAEKLDRGEAVFLSALQFSEKKPEKRSLIHTVVQ